MASAVVGLFLSCYFLYIGYEQVALFWLAAAFIIFPILAFTDLITFDGKRIGRTGIFWRLIAAVTSRRSKIKPREVIHVETEAMRALRRGQNVSYLFRTTFHTTDISFEIGSGRGYRQFLKAVLPLIPENCLDIRSLELRDYMKETREIKARAKELQIPGSDVLDAVTMLQKTERAAQSASEIEASEIKKAVELREVANELRTIGRLVQSLEAFRRAFRLAPANGRSIYEFSRCLHSFAAAKRDPWLERKSQALLRLAERHSEGDGDLLTLIGETYFSLGSLSRAEKVFKKAVNAETAGYRIFRGLGELALRDGKIAHAINYFARSAEFARPKSLSRWAQAEADYLRRINDDDEYMEVEIGRINLFDNFDSARRTAFRVFFFGLLVISLGLLLGSDLITDIGWAVSGIAVLIALVATLMKNVFASRIPFDILDKE
ncbi:MAG TPA: hypothetical protein VEV84_11480 [Pyrinomonadaceae bacterium]|nr:hypothetical protein [Pyrinomonadaceae bacterium]